MVHRHVKLPSHLYISPPAPPTTGPFSHSTLLSLSPLTYTSASLLLNETSNGAIAVTHRIPGFKTSADCQNQIISSSDLLLTRADRKNPEPAFLNSLRTNLQLATSNDPFAPSPSSSSTHLPLYPSSSTHLDSLPNTFHPQPPTACNRDEATSLILPPEPCSTLPSPHDHTTKPPLSDCTPPPDLTTYLATTSQDRCAAQTLISASISQQYRHHLQSLLLHPLAIFAYFLLLALLYRTLYHLPNTKLAIVLLPATAITITALLGLRYYLTHPQLSGTSAWRNHHSNQNTENDSLLIAKLGGEVIGAVILRVIRDPPPPEAIHTTTTASNGKNPSRTNSGGHGKKRHHSHSSSSGSGSHISNGNSNHNSTSNHNSKKTPSLTGTIHAWTVHEHYRSRGVGTALLRDAVKLCRRRGWNGPVWERDCGPRTGRVKGRGGRGAVAGGAGWWGWGDWVRVKVEGWVGRARGEGERDGGWVRKVLERVVEGELGLEGELEAERKGESGGGRGRVGKGRGRRW